MFTDKAGFRMQNAGFRMDVDCGLRIDETAARSFILDNAQSKFHIPHAAFRTSQSGLSLIELIVFIVIVGVAVAGILLVMNVTGKHSVDPLIHKQALAIAESMIEEVELMPFSYCDPDDLNAASAVSATLGGNGCNATVEAMGPETMGGVTEDRYGGANPVAVNAYFDNVNDYDGFAMSGAGGIKDITNTTISTTLDGYSASVAVVPVSLPGVAANDALLITVTVTGPDGTPVVIEGIRTRYSPRSLP